VIALGREGKVLIKPRDAQRYPHTVAMAAKFETEQGKQDYKKRKWIAEPPNGWIKNVLGFRQFSMRGLKKAQAEFKLVCLALNCAEWGRCRWGEAKKGVKTAEVKPREQLQHPQSPQTSALVNTFTITQPLWVGVDEGIGRSENWSAAQTPRFEPRLSCFLSVDRVGLGDTVSPSLRFRSGG
jgi:hypothetical protein